jgi:protein TonB
MKKPILILFLLAFALIGKAQTPTNDPAEDELKAAEPVVKQTTPANLSEADQIFSAVMNEPDFPGGIDGFYQYLQNNFVYPTSDTPSVNVRVQFVVERDGSLSQIKILDKLNTAISSELVKVILKSPKWITGTQNGKAVRVQYTVRIVINHN